MGQFNAYILIDENKNKESLISILDFLFSNYDLDWENNIGFLIVEDDPSFQLKLEKVHSSAFIDCNIQSSFLVVPYFNALFIKYLKRMKHEVATIYDIFLRNSHLKETKMDCSKIINSISKDNIDTIKAYLKCNGNANAAAEELFLHKNSN